MFQFNKLCVFLTILYFQNLSFSQLNCNRKIDVDKVNEIQKRINSSPKNYNGNRPIVRLSLHNINKDDGTGGNSWTDIRNVVAGLSNYYQPYNICFVVVSEDNINRDQYFEMSNFDSKIGSRNDREELIDENRVVNAINIYFIKDVDKGGIATGHIFGDLFPSVCLSNTTDGISTFNSEILAHELGHCLGLFHTHENVLNGLEQIPRNGNLKNCNDAGDLLCDTPADFGLSMSSVYVDASCTYIGVLTLNGYNYDPDPTNIMSYSFPTCMTHFTYGQANRIRDFIYYSGVLEPYIIPSDINLTGDINFSKFYGVENTIVSNAHHYFGDIRYEAGSSINLVNGFSTFQNSSYSFSAKIKPISCTNEFSGNDGIMKPNNEISETQKKYSIEDNDYISISPNPTNYIVSLKSKHHFDENILLVVLDHYCPIKL